MLWKLSLPRTQRRVTEGSPPAAPCAVPEDRLVAIRPVVKVGHGEAHEEVRGEGLRAPPCAGVRGVDAESTVLLAGAGGTAMTDRKMWGAPAAPMGPSAL